MMKKQVWYFLICFVLLLLSLSACSKDVDGTSDSEPISSAPVVLVNEEATTEVLGTDRLMTPDGELDQQTIDAINAELTAYADQYDGEWSSRTRNLGVPGMRDEIRSDTGLLHNLARLSPMAISWIDSISTYYIDVRTVPELPKELSLSQLSFNDRVEDIANIADTDVRHLTLFRSDISSIDVLVNNEHIEYLDVAFTGITSLPDMSGMTRLSVLRVDSTQIRSLDNIDTTPGEFDLNIMQTPELNNIDALLESNIRTLYIDSINNTVFGPRTGTYERLESWFNEHLDELQTRNPDFRLEFNVPSGP